MLLLRLYFSQELPLNAVEQVYLRKEPVSAGSDRDDTLGVYYVAAFITEVNSGVTSWRCFSNGYHYRQCKFEQPAPLSGCRYERLSSQAGKAR